MVSSSTLMLSATALLAAVATNPANGEVTPVPIGDAANDASVTWEYDAANSDNFDGTSVDSDLWSKSIDGWIGTVPGFFQDDNAALSGSGQLNLLTKYEEGATPTGAECDCGFKDVTSPLLTSKKMMQYGYFEIKAKFANADVLSSFWLQGATGEINIFESENKKMSSNYHCFDPTDGSATVAAAETVSLANFNPTNAFHTYGLQWTSAGIEYFIDGKSVRTVTSASAGCFEQPMSIILSVEATQNTLVDGSFGTHTSQIDYFRRWTAGAPTQPPVTPAPVTPAPVTPAPTSAPITPAPTPAPVTPAPTSAPITPAPTSAPITPAPTPAPPITPAPTPAPVTPAPTSLCGKGQSVEKMAGGTCPANSHVLIESKADCDSAGEELRLTVTASKQINNKKRPKGCFYKGTKLWFNKGGINVGNGVRKSLCCTVDQVETTPAPPTPAPASVCGDGMAPTIMTNGICPANTHELIGSKTDCNDAATEINFADVKATQVSNSKRPKGCYKKNNRLWFNTIGKKTIKNKSRHAICCAAAVGRSASVASSASAVFPEGINNGGGGGGDDAASISGSTIGAAIGCLVLIVGALGVVATKHRGGRSGSSTITQDGESVDDLEAGGGGEDGMAGRTSSYAAAVVVDAVVIDTDATAADAAAACEDFEAVNFALGGRNLVDGDGLPAISVRRGKPGFEQELKELTGDSFVSVM